MDEKRFVFDLDNTLVFTDELNNFSYNRALYAFNGETINGYKRITRKVVRAEFKSLNEKELETIISNKQEHFVDNLHLCVVNIKLLDFLKNTNPAHCVIWTSADQNRVEAILNHYKLTALFQKIVYSTKEIINEDITTLCNLFNCNKNNLVVFEDNITIIKELELQGVKVIPVYR